MDQAGCQDVVNITSGPPVNTITRRSAPLVNVLNVKSSKNLVLSRYGSAFYCLFTVIVQAGVLKYFWYVFIMYVRY